MAGERIDVDAYERGHGWEVRIFVVAEDMTETQHRVTVRAESFERLPGDTVEALVRTSFEFLLERESKESLLREFDIEDIGQYFPEYEREVARRLG